MIGLYRALVGDAEADPADDPGSAAFDHAALELARAQVRLAQASRHLAEVDAKVSGMVAAGGFAGTILSRSWAALMDDAGIDAAFVAETRVIALLEETLPPGLSKHDPARKRRLDALLEEMEQAPDSRPTGAQVIQDKGLYRLLMSPSLPKMDPVRIVMKERKHARRYTAEAFAARHKALQRWLDQNEAAESAAAGALQAPPGPEA